MFNTFAIVAGTTVLASALSAQTVTSDPVGFITNEISANTDALASPAFHRASEFVGSVGTVVDGDTIEVAGTPGFTVDQFAFSGSEPQFYVLFTSGDRSGLWSVIDTNTADTLNLLLVNQTLGDTPGDQVEAGDSFEIIPFWTPDTLFPDVPDQTKILVFNRDNEGINNSSDAIYTFFEAAPGWFDSNFAAVGGNALFPDDSLILRTEAESYTWVQAGEVPMAPVRSALALVTPGVDQDIRATSGLPVAVPISELFDWAALGQAAAADQDKILLFDSSDPGINKSSIRIFTYFEAAPGWFDSNFAAAGPNDVIEPGQGFIYRKASASGDEVIIEFTPSYQ
ncbi:MAG: TIGR02597 family protein [Opitutales bacterium]